MKVEAILLIVAVYVDDLIILSNTIDEMERLKAQLRREYEMTDLGEIHFCLGIEIERNRMRRTITMNQSRYIEEVLKRFHMEDCKPVATPLDISTKLVKDMDPKSDVEAKSMAKVPYQEAVGSIMYAMTGTRADLAFPISVVSQFMTNPNDAHWMAVKRIMRYLKGTMHLKLELGGKLVKLHGFCDADWAGDINDRRSTTGYTFLIGGGAICWNSKRQPTIALSTTEAEYMSSTHGTKEAIWLRKLLGDMGYIQDMPTTIMFDNQSCIALTKNPTHHARTKHIDVQHHFVREKVESGEITLDYCPTEDMLADVLTKALAKDRHVRLAKMFGLMGFGNSQSGSIE